MEKNKLESLKIIFFIKQFFSSKPKSEWAFASFSPSFSLTFVCVCSVFLKFYTFPDRTMVYYREGVWYWSQLWTGTNCGQTMKLSYFNNYESGSTEKWKRKAYFSKYQIKPSVHLYALQKQGLLLVHTHPARLLSVCLQSTQSFSGPPDKPAFLLFSHINTLFWKDSLNFSSREAEYTIGFSL